MKKSLIPPLNVQIYSIFFETLLFYCQFVLDAFHPKLKGISFSMFCGVVCHLWGGNRGWRAVQQRFAAGGWGCGAGAKRKKRISFRPFLSHSVGSSANYP